MPGIEIGRWRFRTKADAQRHIRCILSGADINKYLDGEGLEFVLALLDQHQRRGVITCNGILHVVVELLNNGRRRFAVIHKDEYGRPRRRDFSWRHVLYPRSQAQRVMHVCRGLIAEQKEAFRASCPQTITCLCGAVLDRSKCHIDHQPPATFEKLFWNWVALMRVDVEEMALIDYAEYQRETEFEDDIFAVQWQEYHEINARLRCLCPRCNLSATRKKEVACA